MTTPKETEATNQITSTANNRGINTPPFASTPPPKNPRLSIISYLKAGINPAKIASKLSIPESTLQYHLSILKKQGIVRKVGYGVWEILESTESQEKRTAGSSHVGIDQHPVSRGSDPAVVTQANLARFTQDAVRAHAFVFTLKVPKGLRNWNNSKREKYLKANDIPYKHLNIGGAGQRIMVKDRKVWLTNPSIIIYDRSSYFAEAALEAKNTAIATHLSIIKHIERLLHTSFMIGDDYKFKVSRQHYALIYNALAEQYNREGIKLEIRTAKGVWFLIDDSYSMNEAETVHPSTAMTDNKKVQEFFNGLKDIPVIKGTPTYTPGFVLEMLAGIQQNQQIITESQMAYATNIKSHITSIQDLGTGVRDMNKLLEKFAGGR